MSSQVAVSEFTTGIRRLQKDKLFSRDTRNGICVVAEPNDKHDLIRISNLIWMLDGGQQATLFDPDNNFLKCDASLNPKLPVLEFIPLV